MSGQKEFVEHLRAGGPTERSAAEIIDAQAHEIEQLRLALEDIATVQPESWTTRRASDALLGVSDNPLDAIPEDVLRQICEDSREWQDAVEPILRSGTSGVIPCPNCQANAPWLRDGAGWSMQCEACEWNACGSFGNLRRAQ